MKIVVTGSEGSLMQAVIPRLMRQGHDVVGVDNLSRYGKRGSARDYEFKQEDLRDPDSASKVVSGADAVIQAAAQIYGVAGFHKHGASILSGDVLVQTNMLNAATQHGVARFVSISSSMVYERSEVVPNAEDDVSTMPVPLTDYGLSKYVGERLCQAYSRDYDLEFTIWRPFNIITPHERAEEEQGISHVFADFIERIVIRKENPLTILGDGEQIRSFTWLEDVAGGIADYSFGPESKNQTINLGNPEPISMKDLARLIHVKATERGLVEPAELMFNHVEVPPTDVRVIIPAVEKAKKLLDWEPTVKLNESLDHCLDAVIQDS